MGYVDWSREQLLERLEMLENGWRVERELRRRLEALEQPSDWSGDADLVELEAQRELQAAADAVVPAFGEVCTIALVSEIGVRKVAVRAADEARHSAVRELVGATTAMHALPPRIRAALDERQAQWFEGEPQLVCGSLPEERRRELAARLGLRATIVAPLCSGGRVIGLLRVAVADPSRRLAAADLPLVEAVAREVAALIERGRLNRQAEKGIRARDEVLAIVSHDIRTPLCTIRMASDLLARWADRKQQGHKELDAIQRAVTSIEHVIRVLQDTALIDHGRFTIAADLEDMRVLLDEAVRVLRPHAEARGQRLSLEVRERLPPVPLDRERVLQVVTNLLANAVKFTGRDGQIRVAARVEGQNVVVSISDEGIGIGHADLPHVFDRYWKGREKNIPGTGLGLYIARSIVEAHGGRIWAESTVARGSTFSFSLPAAVPAAARPAAEEARQAGSR